MKKNSRIPKTVVPSSSNTANMGGCKSVKTTIVLEDSPPLNPIRQKIWQHKQDLPIYSIKTPLLQAIDANQVLIVRGETGSGKSTQITQYLYEAGYASIGKIGCTQPRRLATKSLAQRVAEEVGTTLGDQVGYKVRFDHKATLDTTIIYMTDGILLHELAIEPTLNSYSAIILDEAHERLLQTDMLLGLLKSVAKRRAELRLIIASATMDCNAFSEYFDNASVFEIPGRIFPVEIHYETNTVLFHIDACLSTIKQIHKREKPGDILVFLPGQLQIDLMCEKISNAEYLQELYVLPCYAALSVEEQNKVLEPVPAGRKRKVVIATNIAETSLTIDGIVYVVDSGIMKEGVYNPKKRLLTLVTKPITQAQANQRSGRAGRTQPGKAFRLYSEGNFQRMQKSPVPEIQRGNLESKILLLTAHGVEDIYKFDFMDPPKPDSIRTSLMEMEELEALDSNGRLTPLGTHMITFPLEPRFSKMLIQSVELGCSQDILTIVSMLSVQGFAGKIFLRPKKFGSSADSAKARFFRPEGDYATLLNVFNTWVSNHRSEEWCREHYVNFNALEESVNVRNQLEAIMESTGLRPSQATSVDTRDNHTIRKAIVAGYFSHIARKSASGFGYSPYSNPHEFAFIHPSSSLFKNPPKWVLYEELINTGRKPNLIHVNAIEPEWVRLYAPSFYKKLEATFPSLKQRC